MSLLNKKKIETRLTPGRLLDVGGFKLHTHCTGPTEHRAKLPTVVIEAGCGWPAVMYCRLQTQLSKFLRVLSYDRAGLGWSGESHQPRDAEHIASNLHSLLNKVGIEGPILLAGHSIAGLYLRVYAHKYPQNIVGLVLLDASNPMQYEVLSVKGVTLKRRLISRAMGLYAAAGLTCLYNPSLDLKANYIRYLPDVAREQLYAVYRYRHSYITPILEFDAFNLSARQALQYGDLGDLPLLIISAPNECDIAFSTEYDRANFVENWMALQMDLLNISSDSQHKIIDGAGHCTLITKQCFAEQTAEAVLQFVKMIAA